MEIREVKNALNVVSEEDFMVLDQFLVWDLTNRKKEVGETFNPTDFVDNSSGKPYRDTFVNLSLEILYQQFRGTYNFSDYSIYRKTTDSEYFKFCTCLVNQLGMTIKQRLFYNTPVEVMLNDVCFTGTAEEVYTFLAKVYVESMKTIYVRNGWYIP